MYAQNKFGDLYKLFLLVNPEDDKPIAVVVPKKTLQPETIGDFLALAKIITYTNYFQKFLSMKIASEIPVVETKKKVVNHNVLFLPFFLQLFLNGLLLVHLE